MTELTATPPGASPVAASASSPGQGPGTRQSVVTSDFDTFIRMLTVQVENQDPLNPIDSTDFATQLATFSGVEQQVLTNELLTSLGAQLGTGDLSQYASWIGMEARVAAPVLFDGTPVKVTLSGDPSADANQLVVRDAQGAVVLRQDITGDRQTLLWPGKDSFGNPLPPGRYTLDVVSIQDGAEIAETAAEVHGRILEARLDGAQTRLVLAGGQDIAPADVIGLRVAQ
ncbi:MAG: flagellar hook capping FlgD N-terminal domain-containing protein [Pseudomonadota bacterium]